MPCFSRIRLCIVCFVRRETGFVCWRIDRKWQSRRISIHPRVQRAPDDGILLLLISDTEDAIKLHAVN